MNCNREQYSQLLGIPWFVQISISKHQHQTPLSRCSMAGCEGQEDHSSNASYGVSIDSLNRRRYPHNWTLASVVVSRYKDFPSSASRAVDTRYGNERIRFQEQQQDASSSLHRLRGEKGLTITSVRRMKGTWIANVASTQFSICQNYLRLRVIITKTNIGVIIQTSSYHVYDKNS